MKILLEQIMDKKLDLDEESQVLRSYKRALWHHAVRYNISLSILGRKDPNIKRKNRIYKMFLLSSGVQGTRIFKKVQNLIREEQSVILDAIKLIENQKQSGELEMGSLFVDGAIAILSYEYMDD